MFWNLIALDSIAHALGYADITTYSFIKQSLVHVLEVIAENIHDASFCQSLYRSVPSIRWSVCDLMKTVECQNSYLYMCIFYATSFPCNFSVFLQSTAVVDINRTSLTSIELHIFYIQSMYYRISTISNTKTLW